MSGWTDGSIGIFIPTIYGRPGLINEAIESVTSQTTNRRLVFFILVEDYLSPPKDLKNNIEIRTITATEPVSLPEKIQYGLSMLAKETQYQMWIGDDDKIQDDWLEIGASYLDSTPKADVVFGNCSYITEDNIVVGENKWGRTAIRLMNWGPNLIPQPSCIWRSESFETIGGLDVSLTQAFDYDLFLRLKIKGHVHYLRETASSFRWHPSSLSVMNRTQSAFESSKVRLKNASRLSLPLRLLTEPIVFCATWLAGKTLSAIIAWRLR